MNKEEFFMNFEINQFFETYTNSPIQLEQDWNVIQSKTARVTTYKTLKDFS